VVKFSDVSEVFTAAIYLMMEAVSTSDTSVNFYHTTQCSILEDIFIVAAVRT
jgi:hypothetical protein